ncbi:hypothetical protein EV187_2780 [Agromyces ramosus]|jgi:hypothetical protein|uniref:Uncharacterized protein n=1 Tax=Agromyces ramosus TaxID=33879 RepID=A0A4Q7M980_9MICO|nr:hypothetical protein [Agromyces ramosus]RZS64394.1 hypothetical protein EV187_2780 [Agromyces ramosus]
MAAPRIYLSEGALTVTAFPLSEALGFVVHVGDDDPDGLYLGAVFHENARWIAYGSEDPSGRVDVLGSGEDLDDVVEQCFLSQVRITDDSDS